jgi:CxxC motif-containing protein (DUF1111 family)
LTQIKTRMTIRINLLAMALGGLMTLFSCDRSSEVQVNHSDELASGGENMTIYDASSQAFGQAGPGLSANDHQMNAAGDVIFEAAFVAPPSPVFSGLGPIMNNNTCSSCHINDGRGRPPLSGQLLQSMLFRISIPGVDPTTGGPLAVPGFGTQVQTQAVTAVSPEMANVQIDYENIVVTYSDGSSITLRSPTYAPVSPYTPLPSNFLLSARIAPGVFGLGLLEAIDNETIIAMADINDDNGDGISGKVNYVYDQQSQSTNVGRFGWKANEPNLRQQTAGALNQDMGITNSLFPDESSAGQSQAVTPHPVEISDDNFQRIVDYIRTLGVPARRNVNDAKVVQGEVLFTSIRCGGCHVSKIKTGISPYFSELSNQTIHPYTDLLLHDMGAGLADNRPDFLASGSEFRTAPLWGIGLVQVVNNYTFFLHDGRARSLEEAILWHGGEGQKSKEAFINLSKSDRDALIAFLQSL